MNAPAVRTNGMNNYLYNSKELIKCQKFIDVKSRSLGWNFLQTTKLYKLKTETRELQLSIGGRICSLYTVPN